MHLIINLKRILIYHDIILSVLSNYSVPQNLLGAYVMSKTRRAIDRLQHMAYLLTSLIPNKVFFSNPLISTLACNCCIYCMFLHSCNKQAQVLGLIESPLEVVGAFTNIWIWIYLLLLNLWWWNWRNKDNLIDVIPRFWPRLH